LDELLTVDELADMLKVPRTWIYQRTRRRGDQQLPHVKIGKYTRFEATAVRDFLKQQRKPRDGRPSRR
jgi:excisionase family DNA binding protein